MSIRSLFKPDWQTAVVVLAVVVIAGDIAYSLFRRASPADLPALESPSQVAPQGEEIIQRLSSTSDGTQRMTTLPSAIANDPNAVTVPPRRLSKEEAHEAAVLTLKQLDYETLRAMQVQILGDVRGLIQEHGAGPDGVTMADVERMQKNGQIPQ